MLKAISKPNYFYDAEQWNTGQKIILGDINIIPIPTELLECREVTCSATISEHGLLIDTIHNNIIYICPGDWVLRRKNVLDIMTNTTYLNSYEEYFGDSSEDSSNDNKST